MNTNTDTYKWVILDKPSRYPVYDNGKKALPKGISGLEVAYGQSSRPILDKHGKPTGKMQNVYRYGGKIYNA